jgi:hypothetical protein
MKNLLLITALLLSQYNWAQVQVEIHWDDNPGMNYNGQTLNIDHEMNSLYVYMHCVNTSSSPLDILFRRVILSSTATFSDQFCDNSFCFPCTGNDWTAPQSISVSAGDSTIMKPQFYFSTSGTASLRYYILDNSNSTIIDSVDVNINCSVGLEDQLVDDISEYPNPVNNILNIDVPNDLSLEIDFVLYRITGQEVFKSCLIKGVNKFNLERMSSGVYFYTISSSKEIVKTKKLIIN